MPRVSRIFIKTGLIYFLTSLIAGVALEIESVTFPALMPLFWHMLMVGWITQIIFGVSLWMFPGRTREEGFKPQLWGWLTYIFLNTGLIFRVIAEPMLTGSSNEFWNIMILLSAVLQVAGGATYLIEMWPRIQSKKQRRRKRRQKQN